jgi:RNA polymerase primary sigma factor
MADTSRKTRKPKDPPAAEGDARAARERGSVDSLNVYIREIARFKPLTPEQEKELGRRIREGDQEAIDQLVESNLRFVVHYAKRYRGLGMSYMDLIHEGSLGLMEAAKRFDPDRNVKFISYAVWWVRQAIFHALSEHARVFRLPQKLSGQVSRLRTTQERLKTELERPPTVEELTERTARDRLRTELGRDPTPDELAERVALTKDEVDRLLLAASDDVSLSAAVGEDGSLELGDTLEQDTVPSGELELIRSSFERRIQDMVGGLDDKEREVINMRFGLDGEEPKTLQEIGETMGLSRERIRQIESRAKEKLRRSREVQGLRNYLN